jgi:drug/metabolite transporter (DMT)-like permease
MVKRMALKPRENPLLGSVFLLIAWIFGTAMASFAKVAFESSNVWYILLAQNGIAWALLLPWAIYKRKQITQFQSWKLLLIRTTAGLISFGCFFVAVKKTELVNAILMNNSAPLFIPLIAWIWLRAKIHSSLWTGIAIGFAGIALILQPSASLLKEIGVLFGLISGILLAIVQVSVRLLASREPITAVLFYYFLIGAVISGIGALITRHPLNCELMWLLGGIGLCMLLFQLFVFWAFLCARPARISVMNYSAIVYSALIGWLVWNQTIDLLSWLGISAVVLGGGVTLYLDHCFSKKEE